MARRVQENLERAPETVTRYATGMISQLPPAPRSGKKRAWIDFW